VTRDPLVSTGMVRKCHDTGCAGFPPMAGIRDRSPPVVSMLPVHSDLFLYDMRERNNRLILGEFILRSRLFLLFQWKQGGAGP
ncbi:MAG TPA: hypothetical protein VEI51_07175, partial [Methanomicrobiales archaeon]|nr:hypothetical protein [Methanomicrobiales archaeon]